MEYMKSFGQNLKELMERDRVSVAHVAKAIGEPTKTVQEWTGPHGRSPRSLDVLPKLAAFFKVSITRLVSGEEEMHSALHSMLERTEIHTGLYEISIKKVKETKG
jgi:transcriptional regulator with XRE-family HTH domain